MLGNTFVSFDDVGSGGGEWYLYSGRVLAGGFLWHIDEPSVLNVGGC